jgi:tetratricopeptide (TPR) repeat protein
MPKLPHIIRNSIFNSILATIVLGVGMIPVYAKDSAATPSQSRIASGSPHDAAYVLALAKEAYLYWISNPQEGIVLAREVVRLSDSLNFPRAKAEAFGVMGWCHYVRSEYTEAMTAFLSGQEIAERIGDSLTLGIILQRKGNLIRRVYKDAERSQKEHLRAFQMLRTRADSTILMELLQDLGIDELLQMRCTQALAWLEPTLTFYERRNDTTNIVVSLGYIAESYEYLGKRDIALSLVNRAIQISILKQLNRALAFNYPRRARILNALGRHTEAIRDAQAGLPFAAKARARDQLTVAYSALAEAYRSIGNFQQADMYQVLLTQLQDSLFADKIRNTLVLEQANFDTQKKEAQITLLAQEQTLRSRINIGLGGFVVVLLLSGVLIVRYAQTEHKTNALLKERNEHISQQANELQVLNYQLSTANEEIQRQLSRCRKYRTISRW